MEWNERLRTIIDYIEEHLQRSEEAVDREEIADMAGCSYGFFQKVFSYMNDISLADYIRYRKMTLAGYDVKSTDMKIVDISYRYGYDSPTSFTKAFVQFHGVSPKEARAAQVTLRVFAKMQVYDQHHYTWRLEKKPAFQLVGKCIHIDEVQKKGYTLVPQFWDACKRDGTHDELYRMAKQHSQGIFGLALAFDEAMDTMEYAIMAEHDKSRPGFVEYSLPCLTWAVFDCYGAMPHGIQKGWTYLQEEWLVKYPFAHADAPDLEWYSKGDITREDYHTQIWIAIKEE